VADEDQAEQPALIVADEDQAMNTSEWIGFRHIDGMCFIIVLRSRSENTILLDKSGP
jgi:hypothetical protein